MTASAGDRAAMALKGTLLLLCLGGAFLAFQSPRDSEMLTPVKLLSEEATTAKSAAELRKELTEAFRSAVKHAKAASAPISDVNIPVVRGPPNQKTPSVANGSENTFVTAESHLWTAVAVVEHEGEEEAAAAVQKVVRKRQESASEEEAKKEAEEETATVEMDDAKKEAVEARTNEEEEANLHANVRAKAHDDVRAPTAAASPGPMGLDTDVRAPTAAAGPGPVGLDTVQPQTSSVESTDSLEKELENAAAAVKEGKSWSIADLLGSESVVAPAPTTSSPSDVSKHVKLLGCNGIRRVLKRAPTRRWKHRRTSRRSARVPRGKCGGSLAERLPSLQTLPACLETRILHDTWNAGPGLPGVFLMIHRTSILQRFILEPQRVNSLYTCFQV